jgi:hypothetical protein
VADIKSYFYGHDRCSLNLGVWGSGFEVRGHIQ